MGGDCIGICSGAGAAISCGGGEGAASAWAWAAPAAASPRPTIPTSADSELLRCMTTLEASKRRAHHEQREDHKNIAPQRQGVAKACRSFTLRAVAGLSISA